MNNQHQPVLLKEAIEGLKIQKSGYYIDGTFGRGGHSQAILDQLGEEGKLFVFDKDKSAFEAAQQIADKRIIPTHSSITEIADLIEKIGFKKKINGIIIDLGVSSPQLDDAKRGFSFSKDGPLDMRMNQNQAMDAATWINQASCAEIANILWQYGEERHARRIARAIERAREKDPITRTKTLADIIVSAIPVPRRKVKRHLATKSFQAIRIYINSELDELKIFLSNTERVLAIGGRLCVITFHSLEDRIVKHFMKRESAFDNFPSKLPIRSDQLEKPYLKIINTKKPTPEEIDSNPRARSARLRIAERVS